jgi:glutamyl-tRNA synthetase
MESADAARRAYQTISDLPSFEVESLESALRVLAEEMGLKAGQLFGILRLAVTGQPVSPPLFESMAVVGKQEVLDRIERATVLLEDQVARK